MAVAKDTQQFCVRWNSYQSNLQSAFPKLLTSEHFVDVTLACESRMVKCHKLVLSACSAYFEKLLVDNPCSHPIIFMKDMKYWEVQALVDFMYKGEVNVTQEELGTLLKAAEALEVRGLCGQQEDGSSLPRDTVMAGESKKRRLETEVKEDLSQGQTKPESASSQPSTPSQIVSKSPSTQPETPKPNLPSAPQTTIKQEVNVADNGLFEDLDDDFYQDDNSLQIDETGSAYALPGPSGQPPLDNSPAEEVDWKGSVLQIKTEVDPFDYSVADFKPELHSEQMRPSGRPFLCYRSPIIKRPESVFRSAAEDLLRGQTLIAVAAQYQIPRSTLHDYMKKNGLISAWRQSRGRRPARPGMSSTRPVPNIIRPQGVGMSSYRYPDEIMMPHYPQFLQRPQLFSHNSNSTSNPSVSQSTVTNN